MYQQESPEQEARRKLAESTQRLEEARERHRVYWFLIRLAGEEMEAAYDAYMEADTGEAWAEFDSHAAKAAQMLKDAICYIPDYTPLWVEEMWKATIEGIGNLHIDYWERWGKRVKAERKAVRRPHGYISCPSLLVHRGVKDMTTMSADDIEWCLRECPYQDRCELPVPRSKQQYIPASTR